MRAESWPNRIGIVGCGTMGSGIALTCAQAGYDVLVSEVDDAMLARGFKAMDDFLNAGIARGKITIDEKNLVLGRIKGTIDLSKFNDRHLVIEAIREDSNAKKDIFSILEETCSFETIFGTNTSSLSIIDLAAATKRPEKFVGIHFMNPAPLMKLVEIVRSLATSDETVGVSKAFAESLGKTVIIAKDRPGFIVNYLQYPFRLNAIRMLESGMASKEDIDAAATLGLGHPMGPLALQDLVGLDVTYAGAMTVYQQTGDPLFFPPLLMRKMIEAGWLGRKSGKGFYEYQKK